MRLVVHPGAEPWRPSPAFERRLLEHFSSVPAEVHLHPRRDLPAVFPRVAAPYAFRAVTVSGRPSLVFVDGTETRDSIEWLIAHEMTHQAIALRPGLKGALLARRPGGDPASDAYHALDPEEKVCDDVATRLRGVRYDRAWWRRRTLS